MKRTLTLRIWIASAAALSASVFVWLYNDIQKHNLLNTQADTIAALQIFIKLQWLGFLVPAVGACGALCVKNSLKRRLLILPDLLFAYALVWNFIVFLLWQLQYSPVIGLQGIK